MIPFGSSLGVPYPLTSGTPSGAAYAPHAATTAPPVVAATLPLGAPSGITAPLTGAMGGQPAPVDLQCAVGNCRSPQANWHTGFCEAHQERYLDRVYEYTRDIGRGEL
jgi:hypothetical protein